MGRARDRLPRPIMGRALVLLFRSLMGRRLVPLRHPLTFSGPGYYSRDDDPGQGYNPDFGSRSGDW